ncbi:hypothetical protein J1N35_023077 [Gossypium stocksii]|uniref:Uncharacterized protein n=1 Tax=Gossypium stocksii TaxID=47602 RepID=A0A9D4A1R6_9ROSI|nr:hypothetical protein J1N35_023077 [Gossypium stocksii]
MARFISILITPSQLPIYRPPSHEGSHEAPLGNFSFYQSSSPYGIQTPPPWVMQIPLHSLFYQGGSSSQYPQPDPIPKKPQSSPEQPQPLPEAKQMRNPKRNHRRSLYATNSSRHQP